MNTCASFLCHAEGFKKQKTKNRNRNVDKGAHGLHAEFNGNKCESCCSLEQLVASLCAVHVGNPHPVRTMRRQKATTPGDTYTDQQVCCTVEGPLDWNN